MLPFPANLPVSRRLMSKPQEETNSTVSIPPHSAWNVCPRTASFPACIPSKSRNLLSFKNNKYGGEIMFSTEQHQFYRSVSGDLWLCKNILVSTFLLGAINTATAIYSFPAAIKIIPHISQHHGKLAPLTIFSLSPVVPTHGCRRMDN